MTVVYITGASAGLGRAIAASYAKAGYSVGIIAREEISLREAAESMGDKVYWTVADVSKFEQLDAAAKKLEATVGPPDIWINNAMATIFSRFEDITPEEFAQSTNITYLGAVYGLQIALRMMKPRNKGHIIQIGSALAYRAIPLQAPYCGAKEAIRGAVDSLRCELIHDKSPLRITMVHMPAMNTPQFDWARRHVAEQPQPAPPIYAPEACAKAVLWTAQNPSCREVWVGKPTFQAILANKLCPAIMDYYMAHRAYEGQFEHKSDIKNTEGNLFSPVTRFHKTEGRFASRQNNEVMWVGTSWKHEVVLLLVMIVLAFLFVGLLIAVV